MKHVLTPPARDERGVLFVICRCGKELRGTDTADLAVRIAVHLRSVGAIPPRQTPPGGIMSIAIRCEFCATTSKGDGPTVEAARKAAANEGFLRPTGPKGQVDMCPRCGAARLDPEVTFILDETVPAEILDDEGTGF